MRTKFNPWFILISVSLAVTACKKSSGTTTENRANVKAENISNGNSSLDSGLLCYLPFNERLSDESGNGNDGVLVGNISYVPDRFGNPNQAVSFEGSKAWIEIPEKRFDGLRRATIAFDFYTTSTERQVMLSKMSYGEQPGSPNYYQSFVIVADQSKPNP